MVDKMHRNWKWRAAVGTGALVASAATLAAMAVITVFGLWTACGIDGAVWESGSPRQEVCSEDQYGWIAMSVLGIAALAVLASAVAWVARGRGGRTYAIAVAGGLATSVAIAAVYHAFPAT